MLLIIAGILISAFATACSQRMTDNDREGWACLLTVISTVAIRSANG